jgi:hypothetical protein
MLISAYGLFGAGVLFILGAVLAAVRVLMRERSWVADEAEILESSVEAFTAPNSTRMFRGVYLLRYKADRDVREALVRSAVTNPSRDAIKLRRPGTLCRIHYDPHAPSQVAVNLPTGLDAFRAAVALALIGVVCAILAGSGWYASQRPEW